MGDRLLVRGHVQQLLEDPILQHEVNLGEALTELMHLVLELDDATKLLHERPSRLESSVATNP